MTTKTINVELTFDQIRELTLLCACASWENDDFAGAKSALVKAQHRALLAALSDSPMLGVAEDVGAALGTELNDSELKDLVAKAVNAALGTEPNGEDPVSTLVREVTAG